MNKKHALAKVMIAGAMVVALPVSQAQTVPDAGALRHQFEDPIGPVLPKSAAPLTVAPPPAMPLSSSVQLPVKAFRFAGNTLVSDARLQAIVAQWQGRVLGFEELQQATQAVAAAYRQAGWIVRVYLPEQDVTDGIVTIQVVEAVFSGARLEEDGATRVRPDTILAYVTSQQKQGKPLNAASLDRALLLADDLPGAIVSGALQPGSHDGETALVMAVRDEPLFTGNVGVDGYGARSTGETRMTASIAMNSPLHIGDLLRADVMHTEGTDYVRLAYSLPVGGDGWRIGVNASWFGYRLVASEFKALQGKGDSQSAGLDATYPLVRSRMHNLYLSLAYNYNNFNNEANKVTQSNYDVNGVSATLSANAYDSFLGGGANQAALSWHYGTVNQKRRNAGENPEYAGSFTKIRYSVSRRQVMTPSLSLSGSVSGQYTDKQLDSSERFYLGGANGVRAYPVNEGGGSRGNLAKLELRWRAMSSVSISSFYDWGQVSKVQAGPATQTLKGFGVGMQWQGPWGASVDASVAWRDGKNTFPTLQGNDQDGSYRSPRVWLQASLPF